MGSMRGPSKASGGASSGGGGNSSEPPEKGGSKRVPEAIRIGAARAALRPGA